MPKSTRTPQCINTKLDKPSKRTLRYDNDGEAYGIKAVGSIFLGGLGAYATYAALTGEIPAAAALTVAMFGAVGAVYYLGKTKDFQ